MMDLYPQNAGTGWKHEGSNEKLVPTKLNDATSKRTVIFLIDDNDDYYKNNGFL